MALKKSEIELLSNRYSKAIFLAAKSGSKLEKVASDLENISSIIKENEEFAKILSSGAIVKEKMQEIFSAICDKAGVDEVTKNFLNIIVENKRGSIIPNISDRFSNLILSESNTVKAEVISAKPLDEASIQKVKDSLARSTGKSVVFENKVDPQIIGGLKVKMGSVLFDDSVSTKLERLKTALSNNQ